MRGRRKLRKLQGRLRMQHERKTIIIASPMMDMCHTLFTKSLVNLTNFTLTQSKEDMQVAFLYYSTSILPYARHLLVTKALEVQATHILWIDSDMDFPPDVILRFLRHDKPIVGVNCMARRAPFSLTARYEDGSECITNAESTGLEKVDRVGFGMIWTATEVFRKLPMPWFDFEFILEKQFYRGEDYLFCKKAHEAGYEIYIDHDASKAVKHMGLFPYNPLVLSQIPEELQKVDPAFGTVTPHPLAVTPP